MPVELRTIQCTPSGTVSILLVNDVIISWALELPWVDNKINVSCVPAGTYPLTLEWSYKFQTNLYELKNVPGRSECKFHPGNYLSDLQGCIAPGSSIEAYDNEYSVTRSGEALTKFMILMDGQLQDTITITGRPTISKEHNG
jgi:hypothetical protein